jgi:hypothetical protein
MEEKRRETSQTVSGNQEVPLLTLALRPLESGHSHETSYEIRVEATFFAGSLSSLGQFDFSF